MLNKFLKKLGVSSFSELNEEEKATYKSWEEALKGRKLTDEDVLTFMIEEKEKAISRVTDEGLSEKVRDFRSAEVKILRTIIGFINSPSVEKEYAKKQIEQMMK
jgi:DNA-binding MurR/RpiR family transcriptional regulator